MTRVRVRTLTVRKAQVPANFVRDVQALQVKYAEKALEILRIPGKPKVPTRYIRTGKLVLAWKINGPIQNGKRSEISVVNYASTAHNRNGIGYARFVYGSPDEGLAQQSQFEGRWTDIVDPHDRPFDSRAFNSEVNALIKAANPFKA